MKRVQSNSVVTENNESQKANDNVCFDSQTPPINDYNYSQTTSDDTILLNTQTMEKNCKEISAGTEKSTENTASNANNNSFDIETYEPKSCSNISPSIENIID